MYYDEYEALAEYRRLQSRRKARPDVQQIMCSICGP